MQMRRRMAEEVLGALIAVVSVNVSVGGRLVWDPESWSR